MTKRGKNRIMDHEVMVSTVSLEFIKNICNTTDWNQTFYQLFFMLMEDRNIWYDMVSEGVNLHLIIIQGGFSYIKVIESDIIGIYQNIFVKAPESNKIYILFNILEYLEGTDERWVLSLYNQAVQVLEKGDQEFHPIKIEALKNKHGFHILKAIEWNIGKKL